MARLEHPRSQSDENHMPGLPVQAGAAGGLSRAGITEEMKPVARNAT